MTFFTHNILYLFAAGALSVLVFHQGMVTILHLMGYASAPFPLAPLPPFNVPQIWSFVFWGGIWGIVFGAVHRYFPEGTLYWVCAFLFGAILVDLVLWLIVAPIKGQPFGFGWQPERIVVHILIHGVWGLGTALFLRWDPVHGS